MKSWLHRFPVPALALIALWLPPAAAQPLPAPEAAMAPKEGAEKAAPASVSTPAPEAPPAAASEAPPLRTLAEPERSSADEIRARADDIRRRAEDARKRARDRAEEDRVRARERDANRTGNDVWKVFGNSSLPAGERADNVVAVFGSATSDGEVADSVVSVFGNTRVGGPVGDGVVAVFGNVTVTDRVDQAVVSVFGNATVNGHVGKVVSVFGNVKLGPKAVVEQEVICVMGDVQRDPGAVVRHEVKSIGENFGLGEGLATWLKECVFKGRPLAFQQGVQWAWVVALSFLAFYLVLALLFRGGIEKCTAMLETRPGASAITALGAVVLTPFAFVLLCITVVGILVVPFLAGGLFFAGLFGRAVMLAWIGRRLLKVVGLGGMHPVLGVLVGGVLVLALYTVPVVGVLTYKLIGWLGLGVVLYTLFTSFSREKRIPAGVTFPAASVAGVAAGVPVGGVGEVGGVSLPVAGPPPLISAVTMPRAGFWIRFGAMWLDLFLLAILAAFMTGHGDLAPFGIAAYTAFMWKLKGTTIGGVVCNLKVVRLDGRELDWSTAIVRSLACFLSLAVFGLGFVWVAIDDERQAWHDKIAGTTVVRVPKGVSLL
jgi:uncharacterized RDD family membrane protein YckC